MTYAERGDDPARRNIAETMVFAIGVAVIVCAFVGNQARLDRHFMPSFFLPRDAYVAIENVVRAAIAIVGLLLVAARGRGAGGGPVARTLWRAPSLVPGVLLAAGLAFAASELLLRHVQLRPAEWLGPQEEPLRRPDARVGWTFVPSRVGHGTMGGRTIDYSRDAHRHRARGAP